MRRLGHQVAQFAMAHPENRKSQWQDWFVRQIDYDNASMAENILNAGKIMYSPEARKKIGKLIEKFKPDIAHLHIFQHQLSPSILFELKKRGLPVVYTAHDLKSVCPNYKMLSKGRVCEKCKGRRFYQCFLNKCTKNSYLKSLICTVEMYCHSLLKVYDLVDLIVTPSAFYERKLVEFGFPEDKVVWVPNFTDKIEVEPCFDVGDYFVYCGRLSEEKGLYTLVEAMKEVREGRLIIIGTGPLAPMLSERISSLRLDNVEMAGFLAGRELLKVIGNCQFTVIPSEWYENGPMTILESFALGKPVIGSDLGGIPEHISPGENGLIFRAGNPEDLAMRINALTADRKKTASMGRNARKKAEQLYSRGAHLERIMEIYEGLIAKGRDHGKAFS